jgi:hypothetical protein
MPLTKKKSRKAAKAKLSGFFPKQKSLKLAKKRKAMKSKID